MAAVRAVIRTSGIFLLLFQLINTYVVAPPWIFSVTVDDRVCNEVQCNFKLFVDGLNLDGWSLTRRSGPRGSVCGDVDVINSIPVNSSTGSEHDISLKSHYGRLYFCAKRLDGPWIHQGSILYLETENDVIPRTLSDNRSTLADGMKNPYETLQEDKPDLNRDLIVNDAPYVYDLNAEVLKGYNDLPILEDNHLRNKRETNDSTVTENPAAHNNATIVDIKTVTDDKEAVKSTAKEVATVNNVNKPIKIVGLRVEHSEKEPKLVDTIIPSVLLQTEFTLRLFGEGLTNDTVIAFQHQAEEYGTDCDYLIDGPHYPAVMADHDSALFKLLAPPPNENSPDGYKFYICARNPGQAKFKHQGTDPWKILATHKKLLPLWVSLILIVILLVLASLFSGLNLGLMALDRTELQIIANTGTPQERKYARAIMPVRKHGNYLLCTILLSNVAVNSTFTVILDDLTSGLVAVIGSTLAIVFIAEITPQAVCARHGLLIGAKSIWIMKIVMGICAPLAWPTSKLLDYFLGEEIGTHYNRERLKELVKVTNHVNDLDKEEVNIISGALDLRKKTVADVMTKLEDVFMLPITSILDFDTMSEIVKSGYSRIPVYEGKRHNIVTVLFTKDLAFVDPDDNTALRTLCQYYQNQCNFVFEDITLDIMLKQFKEGHKGHMAFVQRIKREGDGDPVYQTVGLVTLEDVIEEMIQAEIVDETDVYSDNRNKKRLTRSNKLTNFAEFSGHHQRQRVHVSPQLALAAFQFLSTSVDPFRAEYISETVLRRLLKQDVMQHIKIKGDEEKNDPKIYVFQEGKPVDYFILILEGRVEVTVGRENLVFEAGPFTYFGVQALTQNVGMADSPSPSRLGSLQNLNMDAALRHTFVPDYSVRAVTELYYITVKRSMYLAAKRATLMEKGALNTGETKEQIEPEVDKLLSDSDGTSNVNEMEKPPRQPLPNSTVKSDRGDRENSPEEESLLKK